jgi:hypothetical protein
LDIFQKHLPRNKKHTKLKTGNPLVRIAGLNFLDANQSCAIALSSAA